MLPVYPVLMHRTSRLAHHTLSLKHQLPLFIVIIQVSRQPNQGVWAARWSFHLPAGLADGFIIGPPLLHYNLLTLHLSHESHLALNQTWPIRLTSQTMNHIHWNVKY